VGDRLLLGAGRAANVEGLGLDNAGIKYDRRGVTVDDHLRTTNPHVFAAGDVCSRFQFTHAADAMARIVVQNALFFGRKRASALHIPWCTYTSPEVAHVGVNSRDAEAAGIEVSTFTVRFSDVDRAILDGDSEGFARAVVRKGSDELVGLTIVAAHAGEMIGEAVLAMNRGVGLGAFAATIHPYPTQAEVLRKLGDAYNRTRLTPTVKGLFERLLSWRR
jgi:pyruvate/2-oxoglutarate dehydrogenase complex dihydrolipoamide dehydrogenase (E3) component